MAPFYADQGYLPNFQIKEEELGEKITSHSAATNARKLRQIMTELQKIMTSNKTLSHQNNIKYKDINFAIADWVMLATNHIRPLRPCKRLAEKHICSFKIFNKITLQTYQLNLKNLVGKIHDVFHVEKLEKFKSPQNGQCEYGIK